jgi:triosephosphate isomerase
MNTTLATAGQLVRDIVAGGVDAESGVEKLVCPPFPFLALAAEAARGSSVKVGAQDLHFEERGAFTGAVSAAMLVDLVEYVIIGHSERRALFGDTDEAVNRKLQAALAAGLTPIVCVGETGGQRGAGQTAAVLRRQVQAAFAGVDAPPTTVVAYEPVWAIGTGVAATAADAEAATQLIRGELAGLLGADRAEAIRILYGGSVTPDNIAEFVAQPDVDGGLVGGASLVADSFVRMVRSVAALPAGG